MGKHVMDRTRTQAKGSRMREFVEIDRRTAPEGTHPSAKAAHRKAEETEQGGRAEAYVRIEKGRIS